MNCNQDVFWVAVQQSECKIRFDGCDGDEGGCCNGLTCVAINPYYHQCQYVPPSPTTPPLSPPTNPPVSSPIAAPVSPPTNAPIPNPAPIVVPTAPTPTAAISCAEGYGRSSWDA